MSNQKNNYHNDWSQNISNIEEKLVLAKKVAEFVKDGDVIGFGSGSTSLLALKEIANKVTSQNLKITAIPTSAIIREECIKNGIAVSTVDEITPNWGFDGADEVDGNNWLIKGRGGAMYSEKMVMLKSPKTYILVDKSKFVSKLGDKCLLPIEVKIEQYVEVQQSLKELGAVEISLRYEKENKPYITEHGNYILDCRFVEIYSALEQDLKSVPGVVESGLFIGYNIEILK